jgi:hypothetical protein
VVVVSIFANDLTFTLPEEDPKKSLRLALAFAVDDWGSSRAMAWVWGVVIGWPDDALDECANSFGWDDETKARLVRLHEAFERLDIHPHQDHTT